MMILGLGNDIIEIERIKQSHEKHGSVFLSKLFTPKEQEYFLCHKEPISHIAGRFAAKEAIAKALGTGFGKDLGWLDIEILNDEVGKPIVHMSKKFLQKHKDTQILLSISHCNNYATAVAIWIS